MAASPMEPSSPWHGASAAPDRTESFQATDRSGARASAGGGEPSFVDDGLVCLLFDD